MIVSRQQLIDAAKEAAGRCGCPATVAAVKEIRADLPRLTAIEMATEAALCSAQCSTGCPALQPLVKLINYCVAESRQPLGVHTSAA